MAVPDFKLSAPIDATSPALLASRKHWLTAEMIPLYVAVFVYVLMLCLGNRLLVDPDTYFHIAAGNWIWAHHSVPSKDPFSGTMQNAPWIAHEWFAEVILGAAYGAGGWAGIVAITAAAIAASYYLLTRFLQTILSSVATLIGVIPTFVLLAPHLLARPHVLAMPFFVAWAVGLARARAKNRSPRPTEQALFGPPLAPASGKSAPEPRSSRTRPAARAGISSSQSKSVSRVRAAS